MKKKILLIFILLLAFLLRFWQLGYNPPSLDWDEASLGYNAYSLLINGKDEYGNVWPLSIRSFGDYKPPLYTYLTTFPVAIFDLNEFSTRFISAFFGTLTVLVGYFLIKELFPKRSFLFLVLCSLFFAVSPWHIQFSRIAFEANLGLFFFILGLWLFLKGVKSGKIFPFSFVFFVLSLYAYHSPRLVVPLLMIGLTIIFRNELRKKILWYIVSLVIFLLMVTPIVKEMKSTTGARFGSVTVVNPDEKLGQSIKELEFDQERGDWLGMLTHNRRIVFGREILAGYLDHFNFDFLFLNGDAPGRHHAAGMGMLYWFDLSFILIGLMYLLKNRDKGANTLFWWFLVAPAASALTSGTPHAVRALLYLPTYQIFAAVGVVETLKFLKIKTIKKIMVITVITGIFLLNFFYYLHMYWIHTPYEYAQDWQYGYKQAVEEVGKIENNYGRVIVTYHYDQPYIYFLFYKKIDPVWYQHNWGGGEIMRFGRSFGKYEFRNIDWEKDRNLPNTILVGTPGEIPERAEGLIKEIKFPDGSVAFRIVGR
jgi:4-amino-4-deoxy-L-arabinose transferase-like glycosyltransferase